MLKFVFLRETLSTGGILSLSLDHIYIITSLLDFQHLWAIFTKYFFKFEKFIFCCLKAFFTGKHFSFCTTSRKKLQILYSVTTLKPQRHQKAALLQGTISPGNKAAFRLTIFIFRPLNRGVSRPFMVGLLSVIHMPSVLSIPWSFCQIPHR